MLNEYWSDVIRYTVNSSDKQPYQFIERNGSWGWDWFQEYRCIWTIIQNYHPFMIEAPDWWVRLWETLQKYTCDMIIFYTRTYVRVYVRVISYSILLLAQYYDKNSREYRLRWWKSKTVGAQCCCYTRLR